MARKIIVVGDSTSHGGVVISGDATRTIGGMSIARLGDMVNCPLLYPNKKPHGVNAIIEGESTYLVKGIPVALHGHKTACGCTLNGSVQATVGGTGAETAIEKATLNKHVYDLPVVLSATKTKDDQFDQHFQLHDQVTGEPLVNRYYEILINNQIITGKTDSSGFTSKITANSEIKAEIKIFAESYLGGVA